MIRKMIPYYKPYVGLFLIDTLAALIIATIDLVTPRFSSYLIDSILPQQDYAMVVKVCLFLGLAYLVRVALEYVLEYWGHILGVKIERDMRQELFAHIQRLPITYFDEIKTGKLMSRLVNDLNDISEAAHHGPEDFIISSFLMIGSFVMMFRTNVPLAAVLAILVPVMVIAGVHRNMKFRLAFRDLRKQLAEINAQAEDNFSGIRVVKAFTAEKREMDQFNLGNEKFTHSKRKAYQVMAAFGVTTKGFIYGIQLIVFLFGSWLILQGQMSIGSLVEFLLYVQLFQIPITKISTLLTVYNQAMAGIERFFGILSIPVQADQPGATVLQDVRGEVVYEGVHFAYDKEEGANVLEDISFKVKPSKTIAFVGPSGGGKSTLCSLLPRFYEYDQGTIYIDGHDIRTLTIESLRDNIGIVQQDVFIFAGTIRENILYGKPDADEAAILEAARKAQALSFIEELPEGLDTYIGQRGVRLSGGQKQRLSLARIFLKDPKILILDEATSALDNETEKLIQATLNTLSEGRTTLVVAHRLSTIQNADWICVVTKEGIVQQGTHQTMMQEEGPYKRLNEVQSPTFNPLASAE